MWSSRRRTLSTAAALALALAGCGLFGGEGSGGVTTDGDVLAAPPVVADEVGQASVVDGRIVVQLAAGPVTLNPNDDTVFFVCTGDDCEEASEDEFRAALEAESDGADVRVLAPNAELLSPDAEVLPGAVWVALVR